MTAPSRNSGRNEESERAAVDADRPLADRPTFERGGDRVAPDGQRIVDQSGEFADERREMERKADLVETTSREQRSHEPSTRFWGSRYAQVGPLLALFAGLFTLAIRTWPIATPQGRGTVGTAWFICATLAGAMYVAGFFLSDRHWKRARMVLVSAALLHLVVGFLAAMQVDAQEVTPAWRSLFFDAAPAVAALIASFLIGPAPGERSE